MKRDRLEIFGIVFIVLFTFITLPHDSSADTLTVYGPESFIRNTGEPVIVTHTFTVLNTDTACTLKIYNSGLEDDEADYEKVSSSVISLNGIQVVGPNEFNQNISLIEKPVTLLLSNEISVEVRGKPGGAITIVIDCLVMVTVPNLLYFSRTEAETALGAAGLSVGDITEEYRVTIPTGVVIGQNPDAGAEAPEGSGVDLALVRQPPVGAGESIPDTWAGEWEISLSFWNSTETSVYGVETVTDVICPGDPVGVALFESLAALNPYLTSTGCTGSATESSIAASCSGAVDYYLCNLDVTVQFLMDINGDSISGSAEWSSVGSCDQSPAVDQEVVTISGVRLSTDPALCAEPPSSLSQKFLRHPFNLPLIQGVGQ